MKPLNVLSKFEKHFVNQTVCFQAQLEADGYFLDLPYFFLHPAESDVFSKVRVCEAKRSNESPSGAFKRQRGLRQQMEGRCPDKRCPNKITSEMQTHCRSEAPVGLLSGRTVCDSRWRGVAPTSSTNVSELLRRKNK